MRSGFAKLIGTRELGAAEIPSEWTPMEALTALWLDVSDSTTTTLNGSGLVQLRDKKGNGRNANAVTTTRPVLVVEGLNGLDVIRFSNNYNQRLSLDGVLPSTFDMSLFVVLNKPSSGGVSFG